MSFAGLVCGCPIIVFGEHKCGLMVIIPKFLRPRIIIIRRGVYFS